MRRYFIPVQLLVLVTGEVASGKNKATLLPLLKQYAEQGRPIEVIAAKGDIPKFETSGKTFGHVKVSNDVRIETLPALAVGELHIICVQNLAQIEAKIRASLLEKLAGEIHLRNTEADTIDRVATFFRAKKLYHLEKGVQDGLHFTDAILFHEAATFKRLKLQV